MTFRPLEPGPFVSMPQLQVGPIKAKFPDQIKVVTTCPCHVTISHSSSSASYLQLTMSSTRKHLKAPEMYSREKSAPYSRHRSRRRWFQIPAIFPLRSLRPLILLLLVFVAIFSLYITFQNLKTLQKLHDIALTIPTRSPTRYSGNVPIVDRAKYAEVEARMGYHAHLEGIENYQEWVLPPNPMSPPKITAIPEPSRKLKNHVLELWPNEKSDSQLCHETNGCRLLLPACCLTS